MKLAGWMAVGGLVLLGGLFQRGPTFCPLPLRSLAPVPAPPSAAIASAARPVRPAQPGPAPAVDASPEGDRAPVPTVPR